MTLAANLAAKLVREILFVAGEASGDLHAAKVAEELLLMLPGFTLAGVGGNKMQAAGVRIIEHAENLAVMGFVGVLRHLPKHWQLLRKLEARIKSGNVALVILLDYPGLNLKVAKVARDANIPVLYYITPQVWAWGARRLPQIARVVTKAACILPFEEQLLRQHHIDATFVGHPLLDRAANLPTKSEARVQLGYAEDAEILAVFPGSRRSELARHLEPFVETAQELKRRVPSLQVIVSVAPTVSIKAGSCPFPLIYDSSFTVLRAATAGLLKSGTTTLEAAVSGLPHVIGYRTSSLEFAIARRVVKIPHIGLVNVVAEREVSREFIQANFVPARVADALEPLLDSNSAQHVVALKELAEVTGKLGSPGAAERVARIARDLVA